MEYNEVKQRLIAGQELASLDEAAAAALFWRGEEQTLEEGAVIYAEDQRLDHTFCLLLSGYLLVEKGGDVVGELAEGQIFGEMAYFTSQHTRTATVRVGSSQAVVLKFRLTPGELGSARLSGLRNYLDRRTWDRFVSSASCLA
jgi:hypothetical protein